MEQFYFILKTFQILWPYQQSIKYFVLYEEKNNCGSRKKMKWKFGGKNLWIRKSIWWAGYESSRIWFESINKNSLKYYFQPIQTTKWPWLAYWIIHLLPTLGAWTTGTQWGNKSKKSEKFGPMRQTKYALAVPKNLGLGVDFRTVQWRRFPHRASVVRE